VLICEIRVKKSWWLCGKKLWRVWRGSRLIQFFAGGDLSGLQEGFDEFAFAADCQAGIFLNHLPFPDVNVAVALGNFRFSFTM